MPYMSIDPTSTTMKHPDDYAKRESSRNRAYREAYASPEARAWADSLTPAERERADALGLLSPYIEPASGEHSIDTLPCALEPREEDKRSSNEIPLPLRQRMNAATAHPVWCKVLGDEEKHQAARLRAFLLRSGQPRLCWACLCCLAGESSCTALAHKLGMSKQAFHYHVRTLAKQLGLPQQD